MSKSSTFPAFDQFVTATTGHNMTMIARIAVICGVAMMVLLTVDPAYAAVHSSVDGLLWACLAFFVLEWAIRLRHALRAGCHWAYIFSFRGIVDAVSALAIPIAFAAGANPKSA
jgi:voltage-gated potassium channel